MIEPLLPPQLFWVPRPCGLCKKGLGRNARSSRPSVTVRGESEPTRASTLGGPFKGYSLEMEWVSGRFLPELTIGL